MSLIFSTLIEQKIVWLVKEILEWSWGMPNSTPVTSRYHRDLSRLSRSNYVWYGRVVESRRRAPQSSKCGRPWILLLESVITFKNLEVKSSWLASEIGESRRREPQEFRWAKQSAFILRNPRRGFLQTSWTCKLAKQNLGLVDELEHIEILIPYVIVVAIVVVMRDPEAPIFIPNQTAKQC